MRAWLVLMSMACSMLHTFAAIADVDPDLLFKKDRSRLSVDGSQQNVVYLDRLPEAKPPSSSVLQIRVGSSTLQNLKLANSYYDFLYPSNVGSRFAISFGYESTPLKFAGSWGFRAEMGYGFFSSAFDLDLQKATPVRLNVFPLSLGGAYVADFHPALRWATPAIWVGAMYVPFFQTGNTNGIQVIGASPLLGASFGLRHSLAWAGLASSQLAFDYYFRSKILGARSDLSGTGFTLGFGVGI